MMESTHDPEVAPRPASVSPIVTSDFRYAPYRAYNPNTRRNSFSSLSRMRDSLRRRSSSFQSILERGLSIKTKDSSPVSPEGSSGLVFHLLELPPERTRDSIVGVLHQSVAWLRENPERGTSPFSSRENHGSPPDLLDCDSDYGHSTFPTLQPTITHTSPNDSNIFSLPFSPHGSASSTEKVPSGEKSVAFTPAGFGVLIDLDTQTPSGSPVQRHVAGPADEIFSKFFQNFDKTSIHPDLQDLPTLPPKASIPGTSMSTVTSRGFVRARVRETEEKIAVVKDTVFDNEGQYEGNTGFLAFFNRSLPHAESASAPHKLDSHLKSPAYLGFGIQPVPPSVLPPKLAAKPALPAEATSSTEFLEHQHRLRQIADLREGTPQLTRKWNDRNLRVVHSGRVRRACRPKLELIVEQDVSSPTPVLIEEQRASASEPEQHIEETTYNAQPEPAEENHPASLLLEPIEQPALQSRLAPLYVSVAERAKVFEKPLPALPKNEAAPATPQQKKKNRRYAIYGAGSTHNVWPSSELPMAEKPVTGPNANPYGNYQPYRPTPQSDIIASSSVLPPIPHIRKGSMLRQIKRQLFAGNNEVESLSPTRSTFSLSDNKQQSCRASDDRRRTPRPASPVHRSSASREVPSIQASPTVRQGTLHELGGRVIQVRNCFESQETDCTLRSATVSSKSSQKSKATANRSYTIIIKSNAPSFSPRGLTPPLTPDSIFSRTGSSNHLPRTPSTHGLILNPRQRVTYNYDEATPADIHTVQHPKYPQQTSSRTTMANATRLRLLAADDEVDTNWQWKRFVDTGYYHRERDFIESNRKGKGKQRE